MTSSRTSHRLSRLGFAAASFATMAWAEAASAAQGPGATPGTASNLTQLVMAIVIYGTSALIVGAGLIGAARGR